MNGLLLSKAVGLLLLPPGCLVLLGLSGLLLWRRLWGRVLVGVMLALLWALSIEPVGDMLVKPLETQYPAYHAKALSAEQAQQTAIVLLGGGTHRHAPEYGGHDRLSGFALQRTVYAAELAKRLGVSVYTSGGTPLDPDEEPEGAVMARWLVKFGVPATRVHAETSSNNTWQNAADIKPMLARSGIRHIILVTSAFHMPRSVFCFASQGMEVTPAPCAYRGKQAGAYNLLDFLPQSSAFNLSSLALHEYLGLLWYRLRYTTGSHFGAA